jgi:hypothetical protein
MKTTWVNGVQYIHSKWLTPVRFLKQTLFFLLLLNVIKAEGQFEYPFHFYQYSQNPSLFNPSFAGLTAPVELNAGNCSYVSYLKANYNYANGSFKFSYKKSSSQPMNAIGFRVSSYNEGKYISGSRFYVIYGYHVKISNHLRVSGGLDMGFISYSIKGTPSTGQFAESKFDSNVGILLYGPKFYIGFSGNQLMNGEFKPLEEVLELKRYFVFAASKRFEFQENYKFTLTSRVCTPYYNRTLMDISSKFLFYSHYSVLLNYRLHESLSFGIGLEKFRIGKNFFNLGVSYNTPVMSRYINVSTIEISLGLLNYKKTKNEGYLFSL